MKRILLALVIASATMLSFNSCTKEYITNNTMLPGLSFYKDISGGTAWRAVDGNTFESYQDISMPELDERYFQDGHVDVSLGVKNAAGDVVEFDNIPGRIGRYKYNVRYAVGRVTIYVIDVEAERAGNPSAIQVPGAQTVKIVLTDADIGN